VVDHHIAQYTPGIQEGINRYLEKIAIVQIADMIFAVTCYDHGVFIGCYNYLIPFFVNKFRGDTAHHVANHPGDDRLAAGNLLFSSFPG